MKYGPRNARPMSKSNKDKVMVSDSYRDWPAVGAEFEIVNWDGYWRGNELPHFCYCEGGMRITLRPRQKLNSQ